MTYLLVKNMARDLWAPSENRMRQMLTLTATASLHVDVRSLLGRDHPLGFPSPRRANRLELAV